jgi:hypothetical protein
MAFADICSLYLSSGALFFKDKQRENEIPDALKALKGANLLLVGVLG